LTMTPSKSNRIVLGQEVMIEKTIGGRIGSQAAKRRIKIGSSTNGHE